MFISLFTSQLTCKLTGIEENYVQENYLQVQCLTVGSSIISVARF